MTKGPRARIRFSRNILARNPDALRHGDAHHERWIRRCLSLAEEGRGKVGNGALVGAVLVHENKEIAQGMHRGFGEEHAERDLLGTFSGDIPSGAILYVNLEPCCHHGKTPPGTDIILE